MLQQYAIEDVMFIDIETVPQHSSFQEMDEVFQSLWDKKSTFFRTEEQSAADVYQRAGIYAEFGKIVCISAGVVIKQKGELFLRAKSFSDHDEKKLLKEFGEMLNAWCSN